MKKTILVSSLLLSLTCTNNNLINGDAQKILPTFDAHDLPTFNQEELTIHFDQEIPTENVSNPCTQEILINFGQMVTHLVNIALDPENPAVVGPEIGGFIQNVINIAIATNKSEVELKELTDMITKLMLKKVRALKKQSDDTANQ